jgi:hypothetical protein
MTLNSCGGDKSSDEDMEALRTYVVHDDGKDGAESKQEKNRRMTESKKDLA